MLAFRSGPPGYRRWRLAVVLPALTASLFLADVASRLMPFDWFTFRAWEAMTHGARGGPFEANKRYSQQGTYGDLAAMSNLPAFRVYRRETFTTDALGLRNPPALYAQGGAQAILLGDSLAAGSGVSDANTLAAQLTARTGRPVYSVAPMRLDPGGITRLAQRLGMAKGLVIYQHRSADPPPAVGAVMAVTRESGRLTMGDRIDQLVSMPAPPLQILVNRAMKRVQNDRILANPFAREAFVATLQNGDRMLFAATEPGFFRATWPNLSPDLVAGIDRTVGSYAWYRDRLHADGLDLLVVLVPVKYVVYRPLLLGGDAHAPHPSLYLEVLERQLRRADIHVINLSDEFLEAAAQRLADRQYLYWLDDTHWNAGGIQVAANRIAAEWTGDR